MPDQPPASLRPHRPTTRFHGKHPAATDFLMLTTMYAPPRLPRRPIHRERLVSRLTDGVRTTPLTLVSAPAGSGKTTLAASWMEDPGIPWSVVWLTLSEATASPEGFWFFVTEALSRAGVDLPHTTGLSGLLPVYDGLVTQLATDLLNRAEPVVLVLDEVDRLTDPDVPRQLELLLRLAAVRIRLVLLSRIDPLLPVQRYRLTGTMTQIRAADLAFTLEEARSLLSGSGIELSDEALETLHARTEGWAAGLQLAALTRQQLPPAERDAGGWLPGPQDANLAEYLTGEILNAQPVHLRDFLLHTSVVDLVSAELAEALTGEAGAGISLVALVHRNILMEAVGDLPGCYHAHPLLRELLRAQLAYESPELVPELHLKAARWFADAGMVNQAVAHFASAGSWERAAELVVDQLLLGLVLLRPSTPGVAQRLADMPSTTAGASAAVVRAAVAVGRSDLTACDAALDQLGEETPARVRPQLDVAVAATRLSAAAARGDHQQVLAAAARLEVALGALPFHGAGSSGVGGHVPDLRSLLLSAKGVAQLHLGALPEASATLSEAVVASVAAGLGAGQLAGLSRYALAEALQGRLHHARELVAAAEKLAEEQSGETEAAVPAALAMAAAWALMEAGAPTMAQSALTGPRMPPEPLERGLLEVLEEVLRSRTERVLGREVPPPPERNGRVGAVPDWLQELLAQERVARHLAAGHAAEARTAAADVPSPGGVRARVLTARADLALGDRRTAARLDPAAVERMGGVPVDVQVDAWLVEAQERLAAGSREQAVTAVRRGVRLARPEALRRPFHEASQDLRRVWATDPALSEAARWLSATTVPPALARVSPVKHLGNGRDETIIVDALSARETEVLRHLADLLTTEEVAEAMFVSVNTVKSHIRSILRKLSVSRRNEAIRRARELDVI